MILEVLIVKGLRTHFTEVFILEELNRNAKMENGQKGSEECGVAARVDRKLDERR